MNTYEINARNEVIPYTSGRKCTDTRAWRDATELELQQQDQIQSLERELNAARADIAEWRILNGWGGTPEIINDFIKGQQTRIHHAQDLETELAAVTKQRDGLKQAVDCASDLLASVTEQRDRLAEALERWPEIRKWLEMSKFISGYMQAEKEFFDQLSEALAAVKGEQ